MSGFGKSLLPQEREICSRGGVQGCGDPNCQICMPSGDPARAGGALQGGPDAPDAPVFTVSTGDGYVWVSAMSVMQETSNRASKNSERDHARQALEALRPKVETYLLKTSHKTAWQDVVGNEPARRALMEAIEYPVKYRALYAHYKKKPTKGVLLYGPPGCGKTMFGKAAASVIAALHSNTSASMIKINGPEIQSPYVGITEGIIRNVFAYAAAFKKVHGHQLVIFIDECDAILPSRDGAGGTRRALPWEESNVATFLSEMDGIEESGALVILATNRPEAIDSALLRDGRCDHKIKVERPDEAATRTILERALALVPVAAGHDSAALAAHGTAQLFDIERTILRLRTNRGVYFLRLGDIVSGAMVVGLAERAKSNAFHRDLAAGGKPTGITPGDLEEAVATIERENAGLNHNYALREMVEKGGIEEMLVEPVRKDAAAGETKH